ncbi:hypothetical protein RI129_012544 [Pyrocoelia pectoralis]|uniref:Phosphoenolpyruvate synthase n=1 Tax=Pyrocoelia pectoralis TaxID=417401 RepID=A0AAN7V6I7_9COLE
MSSSDFLITSAYYCALFCLTFVVYILIFEENPNKDRYKSPDWYYLFKRVIAIPTINRLKRRLRKAESALAADLQEQPRKLNSEKKTDTQTFYALDTDGTLLFLKIILHEHRIAEIVLLLRLSNGKSYTFPDDDRVLLCSTTDKHWQAGGLTLTILEPFQRVRLTYNGFLRNLPNGVEHVKFSLIWNSADQALHYPQDVPNALLTDALAKERWRDGSWIDLMGDQNGYEQYGVLQGIITTGAISNDIYMKSFRKRFWGTGEHRALHRDFTIFVICPITQHDINLEYVGEYNAPSSISFHLKANGKIYKCVATLMHREMSTMRSDDHHGWEMKMVPCKIILNEQDGVGLVSFWYARRGNGRDLPDFLMMEPKLNHDVTNFVAAFGERECEVAAFAGEKGKLMALASSMNSPNFVVPRGFVILTTAFRHHLSNNEKLKEAVMDVKDICLGKGAGDLSLACQRTVELFLTEPIADDVVKEVLGAIGRLGGNENVWAICNSDVPTGTCGKTEDFFNCQSEDILKTLLTCWSSLFTYQNVLYRKQQGLEICCSTAVLLQRMDDIGKSGTLSSCEQENPSKIVIRSQFGLDPLSSKSDTVILHRTWKGELSTTSTLSHGVSITEEQAFTLGNALIDLENAFGFFCQIKWAYLKGVFYVFQLLPIGQINEWTDHELLHEFDSPIMASEAVSTSANITELMPGALTPLTNSLMIRILNDYIYRPFGKRMIVSSLFQARISTGSLIKMKRVGRFARIWQVAKVLADAITGERTVETPQPKNNLDHAKSPKCVLEVIERELDSLRALGKLYVHALTQSITQMKALLILTKEVDYASKLSLLLPLSSHPEMSKLMINLCDIIYESGIYGEFARVAPNDGMSWLKWNCVQASDRLEHFLKTYDKRGVREYELQDQTWRKNHVVLVEMLQFYCKLYKGKFVQVESSPSLTKRKPRNKMLCPMIHFITKRCREWIVDKEKMRSSIVRKIDDIRLCFRVLSRELVVQGSIPNEDLIYHLSWYELNRLVLKQDSAAVPRAIRRQQLYPVWDKIILPATVFGVPKRDKDVEVRPMGVGDSVSYGDIHGRACVVRSIHDIQQLQAGDILISLSVNISWSPYLSMLSGLVTESTGFFSYGAVISKEYRLPCVVGVKDATVMFKTGDIVLLSGKNGTIQLFS